MSASLSIFEKAFPLRQAGQKVVWVAHYDGQMAGYVTLKWKSHYSSFVTQNIPEIMDLNVLPPFRRHGIGTELLDAAEREASTRSDQVGLGVGLYSNYGNAQRLYVKRGYIPDGRGITRGYEMLEPGTMVCVDDTLLLWFTKRF